MNTRHRRSSPRTHVESPDVDICSDFVPKHHANDGAGRWRENPLGDRSPCRPYLVLLPVGFTVPLPLPGARCALTAPFHPCRPRRSKIGGSGGLLSVALSLGSPPPGVTR